MSKYKDEARAALIYDIKNYYNRSYYSTVKSWSYDKLKANYKKMTCNVGTIRKAIEEYRQAKKEGKSLTKWRG